MTVHSISEESHAFIKALGLDPKNLNKLTITFAPDSAVLIEAESFVTKENLAGFKNKIPNKLVANILSNVLL